MEKHKPPNGFIKGYTAGREFVHKLLYAQKLMITLALLVAIYGVVFFTKNVEYVYAGENCGERVTFLPGLFHSQGADYKVELRDELKIGKFALMSSSSCIIPLKSPTQAAHAHASTSLFGGPLFFQSYRIYPERLPTFSLKKLDSGVAATRPLELPMSSSDATHIYKLGANGKSVTCAPINEAIRCDVRKLGLKQGSQYNFVVDRYFQSEKLATVARKPVTTLLPVSVIDSSVKPGEIVYGKPTVIELKTDKKLIKATVNLYRIDGEKRTEISQTAKPSESGMSVTLADQLPRSSSYQIIMSNVEARDGSSLQDGVYTLPFTVSGGPKVTGVNIGHTGVSQSATVVITFDQALSPTQDITPLVGFKGGGATVTRQGNQILLRLHSMPLCGDFSVTLSKDVKSEHDISGDSAWSYGSRTICHTVSTIGYSVKGRPITAYQFGTGATAILYVGATHGNETGTYSLLSAWVDHLEANARSIPVDKKIVVIPALNRDGLASRTRRNASNVDLNRNFPTADWKADVTMPGGEKVAGGGGPSPLSEPETRVLASFTTALNPRLVLTYHSTGSLVSANEAGASVGYAAAYASLSRYWNAPKSSAATTFEYDTTGAYEDWLYESPGIAALLVELSSHTSAEFSRNQRAMWEMMK